MFSDQQGNAILRTRISYLGRKGFVGKEVVKWDQFSWIRLRTASTSIRPLFFLISPPVARTKGRTAGVVPFFAQPNFVPQKDCRHCFCSKVGESAELSGANSRILSLIAAIGYSSTFGCSCMSHLRGTGDSILVDEWKIAPKRPIVLIDSPK